MSDTNEAQLSENAIKVLEFRYLKKDENGKVIENPTDMFRRVAKAAASVEDLINKQRYEEIFFNLLVNLDFLPNTPCLINAGRPLGQLLACFVLDIPDSIDGIFDTLKHAALVHKGGGGTGFSFSNLRPEGSPVDKTQGTSSGPVSFMKIYNEATAQLKQGGVRRGANMGILRVDHPDILKFVDCKTTEGVFDNFNISVAITNEFMQSVFDNKETFDLRWNGKVYDTINPLHLWKRIAKNAWENGEPGIIFIDAINDTNILKMIETIEATNPCAEQPLPKDGSCNLGSINLSNLVDDDKSFKWDKFIEIIGTSTRFLDNIIDVSIYPLPKIEAEAKRTRRIGLGIMGFADALIKMEIRYGSEDSLLLADEISRVLSEKSFDYSVLLGKEKGIPDILRRKAGILRRNGLTTTIAPTGSLSLIAGCSSGCEPVFSFDYSKECVSDTLTVVHPLLKRYLEKNSTTYEHTSYRESGPTQDKKCNVLNGSMPDYFVTAKDIPINDHIAIQAAFQQHIHSGISKTINAPNKTTIDQVLDAFESCYTAGCKSVTFYREGSRKYEAMVSSDNEKPSDFTIPTEKPIKRKRPRKLVGFTERIKTSKGKLYVTVNEVDGLPFEVFLEIGKSGKDDFAYSEAIGRLISMGLRHGVSITEIIRHLEYICGDEVVWDNGMQIKSIPDATAKILKGHYLVDSDDDATGFECPECKEGNIEISEGCIHCKDCGWSKCS